MRVNKTSLKKRLTVGTAIALVLQFVILPAWSEEAPATKPAVSALNGKLEVAGGILDTDGAAYGAGAVAFPLTHSLGGQVDFYGGSMVGGLTAGGGAHAFWRDPDMALLGIYASHSYMSQQGGLYMNRLGLEGEAYLNRFTLGAIAGGQFGDVVNHVFVGEEVNYYPLDDLQLSIGHRFADSSHALSLGAEQQVESWSSLGLSTFASAELNEGGDTSFFLGFKFYFGADKSLIRRHREDDPQIFLPHDLFSLTTNTAPTLAAQEIARTTPPPPTPTSGSDE
ncbi:MAG: hypothetical protein AB7G62_18695 [Magnetospirillum sp.]